MASVQFSVGSCPVEGPCTRLNHHGEATALSRADPTTSIPGTYPGIIAHDHCLKQGLPEPASETEIGPCNYHREGTTFVDSIENYLSKGTHLSPAKPRRLFRRCSGEMRPYTSDIVRYCKKNFPVHNSNECCYFDWGAVATRSSTHVHITVTSLCCSHQQTRVLRCDKLSLIDTVRRLDIHGVVNELPMAANLFLF